MSNLLMVVVGAAGLALALGLAVGARDAQRPPPLILDPSASRLERLTPVVRRASALCAAGVVSGVLVLGLGARLMMRIAAATSPDSAQGRLTEAEETVGEVTLAGTIGFVMAVGLFGGMLAIGVWVALRRWLPQGSAMAGVVVAGIGAGVLARPVGLIDPDNRDFVILSPAWLAVVLSLAVLLAFGVCFAVLADRWAERWPTPGLTPRGVVAALPLIGLFGMSVLVVVPAIVIVAEVSYVAWRRPRSARTQRWLQRSEGPGRWALGSAALLGSLWVGVSAVQVLAL